MRASYVFLLCVASTQGFFIDLIQQINKDNWNVGRQVMYYKNSLLVHLENKLMTQGRQAVQGIPPEFNPAQEVWTGSGSAHITPTPAHLQYSPDTKGSNVPTTTTGPATITTTTTKSRATTTGSNVPSSTQETPSTTTQATSTTTAPATTTTTTAPATTTIARVATPVATATKDSSCTQLVWETLPTGKRVGLRKNVCPPGVSSLSDSTQPEPSGTPPLDTYTGKDGCTVTIEEEKDVCEMERQCRPRKDLICSQQSTEVCIERSGCLPDGCATVKRTVCSEGAHCTIQTNTECSEQGCAAGERCEEVDEDVCQMVDFEDCSEVPVCTPEIQLVTHKLC